MWGFCFYSIKRIGYSFSMVACHSADPIWWFWVWHLVNILHWKWQQVQAAKYYKDFKAHLHYIRANNYKYWKALLCRTDLVIFRTYVEGIIHVTYLAAVKANQNVSLRLQRLYRIIELLHINEPWNIWEVDKQAFPNIVQQRNCFPISMAINCKVPKIYILNHNLLIFLHLFIDDIAQLT